MKVINDKIWWEFVCTACGVTCQAEPEDVSVRGNFDCDGDRVGWIEVVECGKCGKPHDVPHNLVTPKITRIAVSKRPKSNNE
jgi:uncharacterized Zn finger protein